MLLAFAHAEGLPLHWGVKGFSMNVDVGGTHVPVCYGYPSSAHYGQSVMSALAGQGSMTTKLNLDDETGQRIRNMTMATGLFQMAGSELKCVVNRELKEGELEKLIGWVGEVVEVIRKET
jgi:hypothetical protein